ncbi:MAG TPA: hypothetical protein VGT00_07125 [Methylomirabilota bacterium]|jgi:hypothetical protein|nr:hypothetical protein [Methylomirabilota bacterium]
MDRLRSLKGRIGEAFVESIFRRAGYKVSRIGRESQVQQMLRTGISEFLPDFLVWKSVEQTGGATSLNRTLTVEVKYRYNIPEFLQRFGGDFLLDVAEQWPELYVILVTDNPEPHRSCFQAIDLRGYRPQALVTTSDLHALPTLDIYRSTVEEYEGLVKEVFSLLGAHARGPELPQKPPGKILPASGAIRLTGLQESWP